MSKKAKDSRKAYNALSSNLCNQGFIEKTLDKGIKKGIIYTQGSGKTALAYYNVKF